MIYLKLFLTFLEIGAVSFGGGYGMISVVHDAVISNGWLTEDEFINFIAVSESTPGPIAVNIATFVGSSQGGIMGALISTLGVVLPSFIIIMIVAAVFNNLLKYAGVNAFLSGVRPCVVAMILATSVTMGMSTFIGFVSVDGSINPDFGAMAIFAVLVCIEYVMGRFFKKRPSPILLIIISACLGMAVYGM